MDLDVVTGSLPDFAQGLKVCLVLLVISVATGYVLSVPLAVARVSPRRWLSVPVWLFTYVFRGMPRLVQLFVIYYGLAQFEAVRNSVLWPLLREAWFCAWLAFALNTTAYTTEIFAGALRATPAGELDAARRQISPPCRRWCSAQRRARRRTRPRAAAATGCSRARPGTAPSRSR